MRFGPLPIAVLTVSLLAQEPPQIVALDGDLGHGVPDVVERILGAEAQVKVSLLQNKGEAAELTADVYLDGGSMAAPLAKGLKFAPLAAAHPALLEGSFSIPSPDTVKPVVQIVEIHVSAKGEERSRIAVFRLQWASASAVKATLKAAPKLQVFGSVPGLREQLRTWQIPFDDLGRELPLRIDAQASAVGDAIFDGARPPELGEQSSLLLVQVKQASMIEVSCKDGGGRRLTRATLPRAADWRRSPVLYRILVQHLTPEP